ncbi:MAG TPA: hypothetical protein VFW83_09000 [Bryobacteraceae bacterium]|nr:hypothetical protein [Bryobacteraceae bacterium]
MKANGYNSDELKGFYRVLEAAIAEVAAKSLDLPLHEMTRRLFAAAERGERDESRLRLAILGKSRQSSSLENREDAVSSDVAFARARGRRSNRPVLTLFPKGPRSAKWPAVG